MSGDWSTQLDLLPGYLAQHLWLTLLALGIGVPLSLALALFVDRVRALRGPVLAVAAVLQTIPGLALLALLVALLGRIGTTPALIALVLYSVLPVLRNAVTGLAGVDPALVEAGRGLGMDEAQLLGRVRLPLALPVIVAGVRTATVWVVALATLSTPVGATSLGNFIFTGLQTQNEAAILTGCVAVAVLALVLDGLVRGFELATERRDGRLALGLGAASAVALGVALLPLVPGSGDGDRGPRVRVGAKAFTESLILADLLKLRLERAGYAAERLDSLGSMVVFDALVTDELDAYVDYTGTLWANAMGRDDVQDRAIVLAGVRAWLRDEHGVEVVLELGFENAYGFAMRRADAEARGIRTLDDLARHGRALDFGTDYEFLGRPEWAAVRDAYGMEFAESRSFDSSLMYSALIAGEVDAISAYTTDGRIAAHDLVVLADTRAALPPYDAVLLLSPAAGRDARLVAALADLAGAIDAERMRRANARVDLDGAEIREAAAELEAGL
jgi:osmoprotectant transport system permease protein